MSSLTVMSHNSPQLPGGEPSKIRPSAQPGPASTRQIDAKGLISLSDQRRMGALMRRYALVGRIGSLKEWVTFNAWLRNQSVLPCRAAKTLTQKMDRSTFERLSHS